MSFFRTIIDVSTKVLCFFKRNRRITPGTVNRSIKINLGCGLAVAKGWLNIDGSLNAMVASWPDIAHKILYRFSGANRYYSLSEYSRLLDENEFIHHDLAYGIPFGDNTVDFVYSSHFLEHLFRKDALILLKESYRVLKPGGIVRVCVPDLQYAVSLYNSGNAEQMLEKYFFVDDLDSFMARHKYMYDFELLKKRLIEAGFSNVVRHCFREGATPDLVALDNRAEETLFVEAQKA